MIRKDKLIISETDGTTGQEPAGVVEIEAYNADTANATITQHFKDGTTEVLTLPAGYRYSAPYIPNADYPNLSWSGAKLRLVLVRMK